MLKKIPFHPIPIFLVVAVLFYWPLSFQLFSVKNDALTYYYPVRTLISDALRNYELPLWSPFINFGYPIHADMQSGAWNPVMWIAGFFSGYTLGAFHYELIFYLWIAGLGMYKLAGNFGYSRQVAIICGLCYECSGCLTDSIQFVACFSSAAYLPWIFLFFRRLMLASSHKNALGLAFVLFLLFTGGYPSMFIICIYVLLAYGAWCLFTTSSKNAWAKQILVNAAIAGVTFSLLSLPALISFMLHLSHINRGNSQHLSFVLENSMHPGDMISLIAPFAITGQNAWLSSSPIMRNIYFGIVPLLMIGYALRRPLLRRNQELGFLFVLSIILLLMAFGENFFLRQAAYYSLPLMDSFRHPALFRIFSILFLIIIAGAGLQNWFANPFLRASSFLQRGAFMLCGVAVASGMIAAVLLPEFPAISELKSSFTTIPFSIRLLVQGCVLLLICALSFYALKKGSKPALLIAIIADLFLAVQLQLPVTVIGSKSFSEVDRLINRNRELFPVAGMETIEENIRNSSGDSIITGSTLPFRKRIGRNDHYITPGNLSAQDKFYESSLRDAIFKHPVLYLDGSTREDSIAMTGLSANSMQAISTSRRPVTAVYLQNYYPGWTAFIDGRPAPISIAANTFMRVSIPSGEHQIKFQYRPNCIIPATVVSILSLLSFIVGYCCLLFSKKRSGKRRKEN